MTTQAINTSGARYMRQLGFYNPDEHPNDRVTFVGVGGIGSFAAFGAAKLGIPNLVAVDPDDVELHNQPNQMYSAHDVGSAKVDALVGWLDDGLNDYYVARGEEVDLSGVVVSGLDSMDARQSVWREQVKLNPTVPLYIDARIGGQLIVIYTLNPVDLDDIDAYEGTLHSDEDAESAPCTERGVIDVGLQCGALITRLLRRHFTGEEIPHITLFNQETLRVQQGGWIR